jgi:oligoribonuclease (3'-5' exoribonuclease)
MNYRKLCVFDLESDGLDPHTCQPVQIAALMLDSRKLTEVPGGRFNINLKPDGIDKDTYFTEGKLETIEWHAKNYKCNGEDIIERWKNGCDQKYGWSRFEEFINKFNTKGSTWHAPIPCGTNIKDYDLIIVNRYLNIKNIFWMRDIVDLQSLCFMWFENLVDCPPNFKMDTLRNYFGIPSDSAHDAMKDVEDEALIIRKFLLLTRRFSSNIKFRNGCK